MTFYVDVMNSKVSEICRQLGKKSIDELVDGFDENDENCMLTDGSRWFDKDKLKQLLNYLTANNIPLTANIILHPDLYQRSQDLVINVEVRTKPGNPEPDFAREIIYIHRLEFYSSSKTV
jgi:hypothetical protein